jgi:hypothetical protein
MWSYQWTELLIFLVVMDTLSTRRGLMLRRLFFTWMVLKLMEMLLS